MGFKIFSIIILCISLFLSHSDPIDITIGREIKNSLADKSYSYFRFIVPEMKEKEKKFLLMEVRRNEPLDLIDNIYSDPNLYISTEFEKPDVNHNSWSCSRFGDEIISLDSKYMISGAIFYVSVYCEFKCNFILEANLYDKFELDDEIAYTISLLTNEVIKISFKSRKKYEKLKVSCISYQMKPFRIYMAKKNPSSSNTFKSYPIFLNGYYFEIKENDPEYAVDQEYEVMIENKEQSQDLLFWITFDDEETVINELSPIFGVGSKDTPNCYIFEIEKGRKNKNIVISTTLINGSGYLKIGGWNYIEDFTSLKEDNDTYPIIADKSILLTEKDFKRYDKANKESTDENDLYFCFLSTEDTSFTMKVYYQENAEKAQILNYLLPGIISDDILPGKTVTKYDILHFEQNKNINIDLKVKSGQPKLYLYFTYDANSYINQTSLNEMKKNQSELINATRLSSQSYRITIDKLYNKCLLKPEIDRSECNIYAVIECSTEQNCFYDLLFDHVGDVILMKPKIVYSNVITENEKDYYEIHILNNEIKNLAVILTQNTGISKLKFTKFTSHNGNLVDLAKTEKFNKDYMPNTIEIKAKDFPGNSIKGAFELTVIGGAFSSYSLYYYTFDDDSSNRLDHKQISMSLIKGKIIEDYIKEGHYLKVYSYDNSNIGNNKVDLYIHLTGSSFLNYQIYVFKNLNDYNYEKNKVKGYIWNSNDKNYIYISKTDPKYIVGNLYIMVFKRAYDHIYFRDPRYISSSFSLGITDETTPLSLIEGIEFKQTLTSNRPYQYFYYNHNNQNEEFMLSISLTISKIKISLKIGERDYIYGKIINKNYFLKLGADEVQSYCPSKICNIEIKIEAINLYDLDFDVIILCRSSLNSIIYLKSGSIEKRKISINEKQYFVVEANPSPEIGVRVNAFFDNGKGIIFAKKAQSNKLIDISQFPDEDNHEYQSSILYQNSISSLIMPYSDFKNMSQCQLLLTVKATHNYLGHTQGEYSISLSNVIDDIMPNKNYRLFISSGELKYFHFKIKGSKTKLSISMTNKEVDAFLFLYYGTLKDMNSTNYDWKSEGTYNEYLDLSIDDSYFISRKMKSLDGDYYLAIRGFGDTYYNLYISDANVDLTTITEEFPGVCDCDKEGDVCYFRYENINYPDMVEPVEKDIIFYFEFTYGTADIYASLFDNGNNGYILQYLPSEYRKDYKSQFSNKYLRIKLLPGEPKYTLDSVIVLATKCKDKALFDFSVKPLLSSGYIQQTYNGVISLGMDQDNVYFISSESEQPIKLLLFSNNNLNIRVEAKALEGNANVHVYINNNEYEDELNKNKIKGYKHLTDFSVIKTDITSVFYTLSAENSFRQSVYFDVKAKEDCLFSIFLHYSEDALFIPMNRKIQAQLAEGRLYTYIELLQDYEEIIFTANNNHIGSEFTVYAKTSIVNSINFNQMFRYSAPSRNNYDVKATSNSLTNSLSIKIKNIPKNLYMKTNKVITIFYFENYHIGSSNDKISILAYPNVNNYQRIVPDQRGYLYSSLSSIEKDEIIYVLKKQNANEDLLIIEISSCKGSFGFTLSENLPINDNRPLKTIPAEVTESKGKKIILAKIKEDIEYYLSIYGLSEDQMVFDEKDNKGIDFLLYYYTTKSGEYTSNEFSSKMEYELKGPGNIILDLPSLEEINSKYKPEDFQISVIITTNLNEYNYMDSICYLSRKFDFLNSNNYTKNYTVEVYQKSNKVEIDKLDPKTNYYLNVLIKNKKTGEIISLNPIQVLPNKKFYQNYSIMIILSIVIVILIFVIFYFYRKYRIAKAKFDYEKNDIKNMGTIPKSITELKKIEETKNKQAKEKYNSLTEDTGNI